MPTLAFACLRFDRRAGIPKLSLEISSNVVLEDGCTQAHTLTLVPYYSIDQGGRAGCREESRLVPCVQASSFDLMQILRIESDLADLEPYLPSLIIQG